MLRLEICMGKVLISSFSNLQLSSPRLKKRRSAGRVVLDDEADGQKVQEFIQNTYTSPRHDIARTLEKFFHDVVPEAKPFETQVVSVTLTAKYIDVDVL